MKKTILTATLLALIGGCIALPMQTIIRTLIA